MCIPSTYRDGSQQGAFALRVFLTRALRFVSIRASRFAKAFASSGGGTLGITYLISQLRPSQANRHNQNTPAEQSDVADAEHSEPCLICQ